MQKTTSKRRLNYIKYFFFFFIGTALSYAQCPTITDSTQSFCDSDAPTVANLSATDNGNGIVWYLTATSTDPLPPSNLLINNQTYFADDNSGTCGARENVTVTIYSEPAGQNFQGVCVDNAADATVADLVVVGNNIQWYLAPEGGTPIATTEILNSSNIYYASQTNPDTGCETSRLAVFVTVGVVPTPTGDPTQTFCNDPLNIPTVSDLQANGATYWYESETSVNPLSPSTPLIDGENYFSTQAAPPCESTERFEVEVTFETLPFPGENASLQFCGSEVGTQAPFDLYDELAGLPADQDGTWTGPLLTSNGYQGTVDISTLAVGSYTFTYTTTGITCPTQSATVSINILEPPFPGDDGTIEFCSNGAPQDLFSALGGTPETGGTWTPTLASGSGIFDPTIDAAGTYTYTVPGTATCPDQTALVEVTITEAPDAGENVSVVVCSNDSNFDLFVALDGTPDAGGTWSPTLTSGTNIFDPSVDTGLIYTYTVLGNGSCNEESSIVSVMVSQEPDAGEDATIEFCSNDPIQDLTTFLGGTPDTNGTWTPLLASGTNMFDPSVDVATTYTYTASAEQCVDDTSFLTVTITEAPDAGNVTAPLNVCTADGQVDLSTGLDGTQDAGGTWTNASGTIVTEIIDISTFITGTYSFTYEVLGTGVCENDSSVVEINVTEAPDAGNTTGPLDICTADGQVDLTTGLDGTQDAGGTWTDAGGNTVTEIIDISTFTSGTYSFTYTVSGTGTCADDSAVVQINITEAPDAGNATGPIDACTSIGSVDLLTGLDGTQDTGGTWTDENGTVVPATIDISLFTNGTYSFTYTVSGTGTCADDSSIVEINITEAPNAGNTTGPLDVCTADAQIDLSTGLDGTQDAGGTWTDAGGNTVTEIIDISTFTAGTYSFTYMVNGTGPCANDSSVVEINITEAPDAGNATGPIDACTSIGSVDLLTGLDGTQDTGGTWTNENGTVVTATIDISSFTNGTYSFTYTVNGTGTCADDSSVVEINVTEAPDAGNTTGPIDVCTTDSQVDLSTGLDGTQDTSGAWTDGDGNTVTEIIDISTFITGTYSYTYTVNGTGPCANDSSVVEINVTEAPDAGENVSVVVCSNDANFDLFDALSGTPDAGGTWSPGLTSGTNIFDPSVDLGLIYTYTVVGDGTCADDSSIVSITVSQAPDAGLDSSIEFCTNDPIQDLTTFLGGTPDTGGTWTPELASGTSMFDPSVDTADTYTYTVSAEQCVDDTSTLVVTITEAPDAGNTTGTIEVCTVDSQAVDLSTGLDGTQDAGGTWTDGNGNTVTEILDLSTYTAGTYSFTYTVTGTGTCANDTSTISLVISEAADAGTDATIAFCNTDAPQDLFTSLGGTPDTGGSWSPNLASGTGTFDPAIDASGVYTYTVSGTGACADDFAEITVTVSDAPDAGEDGTATICATGSSENLFDYLTGTPDVGGTWTPALASDSGIFDPAVDAAGQYTYTVAAIGSCPADAATVTVAIETPLSAGNSTGPIDVCTSVATVDLSTGLDGTQDTGGTWTDVNNNTVNQNLDITFFETGAYSFTYTVNAGGVCEADQESVVLNITAASNAGNGPAGTVTLCTSEGSVDLLSYFTGDPDLNGTWTPTLASGTNMFDPLVDTAGTYTYTVSATAPCTGEDSATISIDITTTPTPTVTTDQAFCAVENITIGDLEIIGENITWYSDNTLLNILDSAALVSTATYYATQTSTTTGCESEAAAVNITINDTDAPTIILNSLICPYLNPTIADLTAGIQETGTIIWYDAPTGGNVLTENDVITDNTTYYASLTGPNGCESFERLSVPISFEGCDVIDIPEGFSPNGDGQNDTFAIQNLEIRYPNFTMEIFNRYGNIVYKGNGNTENWNGTSNQSTVFGDDVLPTGVYFYVLKLNDGNTEPIQGTVYLSR